MVKFKVSYAFIFFITIYLVAHDVAGQQKKFIHINNEVFPAEEVISYLKYLKKKSPAYDNEDKCINEYLEQVILFELAKARIDPAETEIKKTVESTADFIITSINGPLLDKICEQTMGSNGKDNSMEYSYRNKIFYLSLINHDGNKDISLKYSFPFKELNKANNKIFESNPGDRLKNISFNDEYYTVKVDSIKLNKDKLYLDYFFKQEKIKQLYDSLTTEILDEAQIEYYDNSIGRMISNGKILGKVQIDLDSANTKPDTHLFSYYLNGKKIEVTADETISFYNSLPVKAIIRDLQRIYFLIRQFVVQKYLLNLADRESIGTDKDFLNEKEFFRRKTVIRKYQEKYFLVDIDSIPSRQVQQYFDDNYKGKTYEDSISVSVITFSDCEMEDINSGADSTLESRLSLEKYNKSKKIIITKDDRENSFLYINAMNLKDGESSSIIKSNKNGFIKIYRHDGKQKQYILGDLAYIIKYKIQTETVVNKTAELVKSYIKENEVEIEKAREVLKQILIKTII